MSRLSEPEQIFSLRCHTEQATGTNADRKPFFNVTSAVASMLHRHQHQNGGAGRDRTDDILLAKQALSQLSYGPILVCNASGYGASAQNAPQGRPAVAPHGASAKRADARAGARG